MSEPLRMPPVGGGLTVEDARAMGPFSETVALKLAFWAQCMAARFGAPVLLIGSALYSPTPRDVDIRIVIPDAEFAGRYHKDREQWSTIDRGQSWIDDMAKMNRTLAKTHRLNGDVQVWPESYWQKWEPGGIQPLVLADVSPRWFLPPPSAATESEGTHG